MEDIEEWDELFDESEESQELKIYLERTLSSPIRWFLYSLSLSDTLFQRHRSHLSVKCLSIIRNFKLLMSKGKELNIFLTKIIDRPDEVVPFFYKTPYYQTTPLEIMENGA